MSNDPAIGCGVALVGLEQEKASGLKIGAILAFAGAGCNTWKWVSVDADGAQAATVLRDGNQALIISSRALRQAGKNFSDWNVASDSANGRRKIVVHSFDGGEEEKEFFAKLTGGNISRIKISDALGSVCAIPAHARSVFGPFAGLEVPVGNGRQVAAFEIPKGAQEVEVLLSMAGQAVFVRLVTPTTEFIFVGTGEASDLQSFSAEKISCAEHFLGSAPWLASARALLGEKAWVNDAPQACFIVDDPRLQDSYGHLNFRSLLECLEKYRACVSIAFIAWNSRRSDPKVADVFLRHPDRLTLCVHGFDHTRGEFADAELGRLQGRAAAALESMAEHEKRYGVPFDKVMVFPQGKFSTQAMSALKACDYVAVVNTTPFPLAGDTSQLTLRELMEVALTRYSNFPLFTRRYPSDWTNLALDLFLGKPALIVEHQGYFRSGYAPISKLIERLQAMEPRLAWTGLENICSETCLKRRGADGEIQVQFYTNRFSLRNNTGRSQKYILNRRCIPGDALASVTVNGKPAAHQLAGERLVIQVSLAAGETAEIRLELGIAHPSTAIAGRGAINQAKVFARRMLSEFRDNYVDTTPWLKRLVGILKKQQEQKI